MFWRISSERFYIKTYKVSICRYGSGGCVCVWVGMEEGMGMGMGKNVLHLNL